MVWLKLEFEGVFGFFFMFSENFFVGIEVWFKFFFLIDIECNKLKLDFDNFLLIV